MLKFLIYLILFANFMVTHSAIASAVENDDSGIVNELEVDALIASIETLETGNKPLALSLNECLSIALKKNRRREISKLAVRIAEYQHKQALSAYWPQVLMNASISRGDDDLNFVLPEETASYKMSLPGLPPTLPPQSVSVTVPEKTIKVIDRDQMVGTLEMSVPLYTGGARSAIAEQAKLGIVAARQSARRTDLQIIYDVKKMYYGAVLAETLLKTGNAALARLEATLELTEQLYKRGSGAVTKADYLKNKIIVESIRSMVSLIKANRNVSRAALVNTMGLPWNARFDLAEESIPFFQKHGEVETLVSTSYRFNPDWRRMQTALDVAEARIREVKGERLPKLMLTGNLWKMNSSHESGIETEKNKDGWKIGLGMQIPVFNGFLTTNKIREVRTRLRKLESEQVLLKEGIALQINHIFLMMKGFHYQQTALHEAVKSAKENRELNIRAHESELVETDDVLDAQLMESFMTAQYHRARFNYAEAWFHLDFVVGTEIEKRLGFNAQ